VPWFNVTPLEATQTCAAMGGAVCSQSNWTTSCQAQTACTWGYAPRGATCTSSYTASKYCNLGPSFDFDTATSGDQDGLLPTGSSALQNCFADWTNLQGNGAAGQLYDITGNLREITFVTGSNPPTYKIMGGAFNSQSEAGSACNFTFYATDEEFKFYDTGFRCCFTTNPTL
jgi:hypothetical protein